MGQGKDERNMTKLYADDQPLEEIEEDDSYMKASNCKNCAAPLPSSGKCEYCGTINKKEREITVSRMKIDVNGIYLTREITRRMEDKFF